MKQQGITQWKGISIKHQARMIVDMIMKPEKKIKKTINKKQK